MDEKVKNDEQKVMLVKDSSDGKLKAVKDVDNDGNLDTVEPTNTNMGSLLNVNTSDSAVEAFFKKFMEQADNPAHTGIFVMAKNVLENLIKIDFDPHELELHRIDPAKELGKVQFEPLDVNKIDRADLERKGISPEAMQPHLNAMSYGHKSNKLVDMSPEMEPGGMRVPTKGRLSLAEQPDGSIKVIPHYWQEKPNLDIPIHGVLLDEETKANLLKNGNAGKVIELELAPGKKEPCYLSLDKLTNGVEALPVSQIGKMNTLKGVELSEGQKLDIAAGRKVLVEAMTSRSGILFDGYVQINASDKKLDFTYEGLDRNRYIKENKEIRRQNKENGKDNTQDVSKGETSQKSFIRKKLSGVEVPDDVYAKWKEAEKDPSKRQDIKAVYMKGLLVKDKRQDGKQVEANLWVKPNFETGKLDFHKWNPDYVRKTGKVVKPAVESEKQVAVNTHGKTDEATKHVKEPLKKGQQTPTENQQKKQDEAKQTRKPAAKKTGLKI